MTRKNAKVEKVFDGDTMKIDKKIRVQSSSGRLGRRLPTVVVNFPGLGLINVDNRQINRCDPFFLF